MPATTRKARPDGLFRNREREERLNSSCQLIEGLPVKPSVKACSRRRSIAAQGRIDPALGCEQAFSATRHWPRCRGEQFAHEPFELGDALFQRIVLRLQVL